MGPRRSEPDRTPDPAPARVDAHPAGRPRRRCSPRWPGWTTTGAARSSPRPHRRDLRGGRALPGPAAHEHPGRAAQPGRAPARRGRDRGRHLRAAARLGDVPAASSCTPFAVSAGLVLVGRAFTRWAIVLARRRRWVEHGALIVGGGPVAGRTRPAAAPLPAVRAARSPASSTTRAPRPGRRLLPWIGRDRRPRRADRRDRVGCDDHRGRAWPRGAAGATWSAARRAMTCDLLVVPRLHDFSTQAGLPDHIGAIPVMRIRRPTLSGPKWWLKRDVRHRDRPDRAGDG